MKNVAAAIIDFYRDPVILKEFEEFPVILKEFPVILKEFEEWKAKEKENES